MNAVVLAAGAASRFGVPKTLLPAGEGETLLSRALGLALGAVDGKVAVVLGREARLAEYEVRRRFKTQKVKLVVNDGYAHGLSSSLKSGLSVLGRDEAALVLLADQPALAPEQLDDLVSAYRQGDCLAASAAVEGKQRPPAVLGPELLPEALSLTGDTGARQILARHAPRVKMLDWGKGLWSADVDSWPDYKELALALKWQDEATPSLPTASELPPGLLECARQALSTVPAPYLAPEALLVAYRGGPAIYFLEIGTLDGLQAIVAGRAERVGDYLSLLRRGALTLLRHAAMPPCYARADGEGINQENPG